MEQTRSMPWYVWQNTMIYSKQKKRESHSDDFAFARSPVVLEKESSHAS